MADRSNARPGAAGVLPAGDVGSIQRPLRRLDPGAHRQSDFPPTAPDVDAPHFHALAHLQAVGQRRHQGDGLHPASIGLRQGWSVARPAGPLQRRPFLDAETMAGDKEVVALRGQAGQGIAGQHERLAQQGHQHPQRAKAVLKRRK